MSKIHFIACYAYAILLKILLPITLSAMVFAPYVLWNGTWGALITPVAGVGLVVYFVLTE